MREIEVKAQVAGLGDIRAALKSQGVELSEPVTQKDVVWGLPGVTGDNTEPWLRVRSETKGDSTRHLLTLKRSVTSQLDNIECESEVGDPLQVANIIEDLGFELYNSLTKIRQKAVIGEIEVCLDSVEDLGDFIEAEKLTEDNTDHQQVMDELWALLERFGASRVDEVTDGYDTLMNRKLGKE